jgi:hypothetical protein
MSLPQPLIAHLLTSRPWLLAVVIFDGLLVSKTWRPGDSTNRRSRRRWLRNSRVIPVHCSFLRDQTRRALEEPGRPNQQSRRVERKDGAAYRRWYSGIWLLVLCGSPPRVHNSQCVCCHQQGPYQVDSTFRVTCTTVLHIGRYIHI